VPPHAATGARLSDADIRTLLEAGKAEKALSPRAFVRMFKVPEPHKRRYRPIGWTEAINAHLGPNTLQRVNFKSARQRRRDALRGRYAITLDFAGWYDEFLMDEAVRDFFAFVAKGETYRLRVLPMGLRHSVELGHFTTLLLMDFDHNCAAEAYIDNVRFVGSREDVLAAAKTFALRARAVCAQINELPSVSSLDELDAHLERLVTTTSDWLGEEYDHVDQTVKCQQKTLDKIEDLWKIRDSWTWRNCAGFFALLFYASATLGIFRTEYFGALRFIRDASSQLAHSPDQWDRRTGPIRPHVLKELDAWRTQIARNQPCPINDPHAPPDWVIVTDASKSRWAGMAYHVTSGSLHIHAHDWPADFHRSEHSTSAEPWAVHNLICKVFPPNSDAHVVFCSDNIATVAALTRRESPSFHLNGVALALNRSFPFLRLSGHHVPGPLNPTDGMSRGAANLSVEDWDNWRRLMGTLGFPSPAVTEVTMHSRGHHES
jgi:hypothetical protein